MRIFMNEKIGKWLDGFGAIASWACAVHCLALPIFITILPLAGLGFLLSETTEFIFIFISITIALLSFLPAYVKQHRKLHSVFLAISGVGLILLTHLYFEENLALKFIFLLCGACLMTAAHLINRRLCRACKTCESDCH